MPVHLALRSAPTSQLRTVPLPADQTSRRLFAACERLHREDLRIAERTPGRRAEDQRRDTRSFSEEAAEEIRLTRQRVFREQQEEARPRLRPLLRQACEEGSAHEWSDLLHRHEEPRLDLEGDGDLLEAATPETYLAVSRYDLPHRAIRSLTPYRSPRVPLADTDLARIHRLLLVSGMARYVATGQIIDGRLDAGPLRTRTGTSWTGGRCSCCSAQQTPLRGGRVVKMGAGPDAPGWGAR
ncbi:hypothetical protein ACIPW5_06745 [Streptomyces sp. NPDC090077]|uniref:hypothetical protein n=1 Tax=Streptomyces sp. NPDC090077 TaxID=3365938 RepID=UPI003819AF90